MPNIPAKKILDVIGGRFKGELKAVGRDDILIKLSHSLGYERSVEALMRTLNVLSEKGKLIVEHEGNRIVRIALPAEKTEEETTENSEVQEETDMVARPGQRGTTSPRGSRGEPLPAHLGEEHVSEVTVTYVDDEVKKDVSATAELMAEVLRKDGIKVIKRSEVIGRVIMLLVDLGKDNTAAKLLAVPVVGYMRNVSWLVERRKLRDDTEFSIKLPEAMPAAPSPEPISTEPVDLSTLTPQAALVALVKRFEDTQTDLEAARSQASSLQTTNAELNLKLLAMQRLETDNSALRAQNSSLQQRVDELESLLREAQEALKVKPNVETIIKELIKKIEDHEGEKKRLTKAAEEASTRHRQELSRLKTSHNRDIIERNETHERELTALNDKYQKAQQEIIELRDQLEALKNHPAHNEIDPSILERVTRALGREV